jgi:hypothetical protein
MIEATQIMAEQAVMETRRSNWDGLWNEVAQLLLPRQAEFLNSSSGVACRRACCAATASSTKRRC